jgi:hypothetical protein
MSQLLFPTPEDAPQPVARSQEIIDGTELEATEPINREDKIMRLIISGAIGVLIGVLEAVIVSNSLVEIANSKAFSIVFGIALLLLAGVLAWRVWVSHTGSPISRFSLLALALLVGICAILCFVVDTRNVANQSAKKKAPYFALIAMALAFALTFAFSEFINLGICNICCPRTFYTHPAFVSRSQLYIILASGMGLGLILGIMFGSMDVEDDWSANHSRLVKMLLYGLIPGVLVGGGMGVASEWIRDMLPANAYEPLPIERSTTHDPRAMPSGYDDI